MSTPMSPFLRIAPWLGRLSLLAGTVILSMIGLRYLLDPVAAGAAVQTTFGSPAGITSMRVGFGAFPLAFAAVLAVCLFSPGHRRFGLFMVAVLMGAAAGARLLGIALDGPTVASTRLFIPELALLALSLLGLGGEWSARRAGRESPIAGRHRSSEEHGNLGRLRRGSGIGIIRLIAVALTASAIAKFVGVPAVVAPLETDGFARLVPLVATLELASAGLIFFAFTRPLGLVFASAFLGGAIATHLQHGLSPVPPAVPLALLWFGTWLRHPGLLAIGTQPGRPSPRSHVLHGAH